MRIRTQLIIDGDVMEKIDEIAGEKHLRAKVVDTALREFIAREEAKPKKKAPPTKKTPPKKVG